MSRHSILSLLLRDNKAELTLVALLLLIIIFDLELKIIDDINGKPVNFKPYPWPRSQDLKGAYSLSFVINLLKREDMIKWGSCVGNNPYLFILDTIDSWDIDFQEDFDFCEMIYEKRRIN